MHNLAQAAISVLINARLIAIELGKGKEKRSVEGWMTLCPAHPDTNPSLSLKDTLDGRLDYNCYAGCRKRDVRNALRKRGLLPSKSSGSEVVIFHDYHDENGNKLGGVKRIEHPTDGKKISQYHYDHEDHRKPGFTRQVDKVPPYNLPAVIDAVRAKQTVFIVEGEKHVDVLRAEGITATTNVGGAGKWKDEYSDWLREARVVILPDNDEPGEKHA